MGTSWGTLVNDTPASGGWRGQGCQRSHSELVVKLESLATHLLGRPSGHPWQCLGPQEPGQDLSSDFPSGSPSWSEQEQSTFC